jgi:hypothetical protein
MFQLIVVDRVKDILAVAFGMNKACLAKGSQVLRGHRLLDVKLMVHFTYRHTTMGMDQQEQFFTEIMPDGPDYLGRDLNVPGIDLQLFFHRFCHAAILIHKDKRQLKS